MTCCETKREPNVILKRENECIWNDDEETEIKIKNMEYTPLLIETAGTVASDCGKVQRPKAGFQKFKLARFHHKQWLRYYSVMSNDQGDVLLNPTSL